MWSRYKLAKTLKALERAPAVMHIFTEFIENAHARDGREEGVKVLQFFSVRF